MTSNKTWNWFRGLFTLIAKEDPTFELIKSTESSSKPEVLSIEGLATAFNQLSAQQLNEELAALVKKLESVEAQSENRRKAIDKIQQHFSHQVVDSVVVFTKGEIEILAAQVNIDRSIIDDVICSAIYEEILKLLEPDLQPQLLNTQIRTSWLTEVFKLAVLTGSQHEAIAYLKRCANNQALTLEKYNSATRFELPTSKTWTPGVWQALFKKNKPSDQHDLFFKLLPYAPGIERAYSQAELAITPNTSLLKLAQIAANLCYQDDKAHAGAKVLFFQHGVTKVQYDNYKKLEIVDDGRLIPNITIQGSEISEAHSPFYLTKLDKRDPVAAVVGDMTGCCEGIHKAGAKYTNLALTQNFAGFYVLRDKRLKKHDGIIAHCIAWRVDDYIVYSSVETNINYRNQLSLVADFFYMLASKLMIGHGINRIFIWEWIDHTPPFLGIKQAAPMLQEKLKSANPSFESDKEHTICIADVNRPYISLYSSIRSLPAIVPHPSEADGIPFTHDEYAMFLKCLSISVSDYGVQLLLKGAGISQEAVINNRQAFIAIFDLLKNRVCSDEWLGVEACVEMMNTSKSPHEMLKSLDMDSPNPYILMAHATLIYQVFNLTNEIYKVEYRNKGLTIADINQVTRDFFNMSRLIVPFDDVDLDDAESMKRYVRKYFDFCLLVKEFKSLADSTPLDLVRFNELYDLIYHRHPVTGMTLLRDAIRDDKQVVIDAMLDKGINLNEDYSFPTTPLVLAIERKKPDVAVKLIAHGANVNLRSYGFTNGNGETPLEAAAEHGLEDVFYRLLLEGADPTDISIRDKNNLLHHIIRFESLFWVSYLVSRGLDINHLSSRFWNLELCICHDCGVTPLFAAATARKYDLFLMMLKHGADLDKQNQDGNTMLHVAVLSSQLEAVKMFIKAGACLTIKNKKGEAAVDIAQQLTQQKNLRNSEIVNEIFQLLSKAVNKKNNALHQYSPKLFNQLRMKFQRLQARKQAGKENNVAEKASRSFSP